MKKLSGIEYMKAEIACLHNKTFEKENWEDRLTYFEHLPEGYQNDADASNPIGLKAAHMALETALRGEPVGYAISLDAGSSGLQILSLLVSCPKSFSLCGGNLTQCVDSYTHIYHAMGVGEKFTRKQVKKSIMTAFYGSTASPEALFGDDIKIFYETIEAKAPGAWDLNIALQELWDELAYNGENTYAWILPDNFHAKIKVKGKEDVDFVFYDKDHTVRIESDELPEFHKGLGPNVVHSVDGFVVREMFRRCSYDINDFMRVMSNLNGTGTRSNPMVEMLWGHYLESGFLSVRIIEHLTADNMGLVDPMIIAKLLQSMPDVPFELIAIHDCFRCLPNYGNDLRKQYNTILADINDSNLLKFIVDRVVNRNVKVKKVTSIPRDVILNANYTIM